MCGAVGTYAALVSLNLRSCLGAIRHSFESRSSNYLLRKSLACGSLPMPDLNIAVQSMPNT